MCIGMSDPLYAELWHACAGPLVNVPQKGDLVFYFPQGHLEQVYLLLVYMIYTHLCISVVLFIAST